MPERRSCSSAAKRGIFRGDRALTIVARVLRFQRAAEISSARAGLDQFLLGFSSGFSDFSSGNRLANPDGGGDRPMLYMLQIYAFVAAFIFLAAGLVILALFVWKEVMEYVLARQVTHSIAAAKNL